MITSSAHPDDDPRGEEVLVVSKVVMVGERFESCLQGEPNSIAANTSCALPSLLYGPIALNTGG